MIEHMTNEIYEDDALDKWKSDNGACDVEWLQPEYWDYEVWWCHTHNANYYLVCAKNPDLAQN